MKAWQDSLRGIIIFFLTFPFVVLFWEFPVGSIPDYGETYWAIKNTVIQASLSALISVFLGIFVASGILKVHQKVRPAVEIACLMPNFLPALFSILACMEYFDPFPMGTPGIVIVHVMMNAGLVGVVLSGIIESKLGPHIELAAVEGIHFGRFLLRVLVPLLKKDILLLTGFVFSICFTSFAVPLALSAGKGTTLEVLIYEKMRISGNWGHAVSLSLIQSIVIGALVYLIPMGALPAHRQRYQLKYVSSWIGLGVLAAIVSVFVLGYLGGLNEGLVQLSSLWEIRGAIFQGFIGTLLISLLTGFLIFSLLLAITLCLPHPKMEKFLNTYSVPSTALTCFALLLVGPNEGFWPYLKIPIAQTMIFVLAIYKMGWSSEVLSYQSQIESAILMGASGKKIFKEILFPQIVTKLSFLSGIAVIWSCGDFAISRVLAHQNLTLGMVADTLLNGYRHGPAVMVSFLIILTSITAFFIMLGVGNVLRRKA